MSPKRAKAKAKAKAVAALHRPAGRVRQRPAADIPPVEEKIEEKFNRGEEVDLVEVPGGVFKIGSRIIFTDGKYFGGPCRLAGRVRELRYGEDGANLVVLLTGTDNEELLKHATGLMEKKVTCHLCSAACPGEPHTPGGVHCRKGRLCKAEEEARLTWEKNLESLPQDELADLRRIQEDLRSPAEIEKEKKEAKDKKKPRSSSSSSRSKKKKKKKKKRKKEKEREKGQKAPVAEEIAEEKIEKVKRRAYGGRAVAQKTMAALYGGTGLDPQSKIRRKVASYATKKAKRKKETSSSSSGSGESSSTQSSGEGDDALMDQSRIKILHRHGPGLLTAMGVRRMQNAIAEVEGVWHQESSSLPPLCLRYVRTQLGNRLSGAALKEALTLGASIDLMLQGRPAEANDYLMQRLKALERISQGHAWQSAEKLELAPNQAPQISSHAELTAAQKDLKLDSGLRNTPGNMGGKGSNSKGKKGKSDEKGKSKGGKKGPDGAKAT